MDEVDLVDEVDRWTMDEWTKLLVLTTMSSGVHVHQSTLSTKSTSSIEKN